MTAQELKNSILMRAVQGKLVPQDQNDEPASVLLAKIRAEKEQMMKDGKIKKEPISEIYVDPSDNQHYEKIGKTVKCIEDEIPYEIPESWVWCRLNVIIELISGQDQPPSGYNEQNKGIPYITGASNITNEEIIINRWTETPKSIAQNGDLLITCKGTVGTMAIVDCGNIHIARQIMAIRNTFNLNMDYIKIVISNEVENLKKKAKSMIPGISRKDMLELIVPLPPLEEQQNISLKVKAFEPIIDKYDIIYNAKNDLDSSIYDTLKKSILQYAIQGKLVLQDPNDEPACVLLERIRAEKAQLIKEGKIKRDKNDSYIYRGSDNSYYEKFVDGTTTGINIPFEIPKTWEWVRLKHVGEIISGGTPSTNVSEYWDGEIPWLTPADMKNIHSKYIIAGERNITELGLNKSSARLLEKYSILYSSRAPIGYIGIAQNSITTNQGFKSVSLYIKNMHMYLYYTLIQRTDDIKARATGTTFKEISGTEFGNTLIPLPPIQEQHRIINYLEQMYNLL